MSVHASPSPALTMGGGRGIRGGLCHCNFSPCLPPLSSPPLSRPFGELGGFVLGLQPPLSMAEQLGEGAIVTCWDSQSVLRARSDQILPFSRLKNWGSQE